MVSRVATLSITLEEIASPFGAHKEPLPRYLSIQYHKNSGRELYGQIYFYFFAKKIQSPLFHISP